MHDHIAGVVDFHRAKHPDHLENADRMALTSARAADPELGLGARVLPRGEFDIVYWRGTPEHRDSILDESEQSANDCMMICVSRCLSGPLVLDYDSNY
jgi:hypothetical protein